MHLADLTFVNLALRLSLVVLVFAPVSARAASPADQDTPTPLSRLESMEGSVTVTQSGMNGQLALPRGTVGINANLTQTGPDGQFVLAVPGQFAQSLSISNGSVASAICAVLGPQQVTVCYVDVWPRRWPGRRNS